ncbi:hypothetical protein CHU98_g10372 [Xylaria longipes]|nr:hypothetical protein CHU98_g10372 [Xylaria longipes]
MAICCGIAFAAFLYIIINIPLCAILNAPRVGETWGSVITSGRPQKVVVWGIVQSVLAIGLDLFIFILLISIVMKLHLSMKKKIRLLAVVTVAAVVEAVNTNDGTWKYTSLLLCNVVEADLAIIISCTPGFANFARAYLPKLEIFKSLRSSTDSDVKFKDDPNMSRTGKWLKNPASHSSDILKDTYILQNTLLAEMGMSTNPILLLSTLSARENL